MASILNSLFLFSSLLMRFLVSSRIIPLLRWELELMYGDGWSCGLHNFLFLEEGRREMKGKTLLFLFSCSWLEQATSVA